MGEFVVASGNAAELLDATEESLDQITILVATPIKRALNETITAWRDDRFDACRCKVFKDCISVVSLICAERIRFHIPEQLQGLRAVAGFASRQAKSGERPQAFNQRVDFGA